MATVTYRAPEGDDERVIMREVKFFNGVPVEVTDPASVAAFKGNRFFDVADIEIEAIEEDAPKRRGRPPKHVEAELIPADEQEEGE